MMDLEYRDIVEDIKLCYLFKYENETEIFERLLELENTEAEHANLEYELSCIKSENYYLQKENERLKRILEENEANYPIEI